MPRCSALETDTRSAAAQVRSRKQCSRRRARGTSRRRRPWTRAQQLRDAGLLAASEFDRIAATAAAAKAQEASAASAVEKNELSRTLEPAPRRTGPRRTRARPGSVVEDHHHRANQRHRHPAGRRARRNGGDGRAEPAGHDPDDHFRSQHDQRRGQSGGGRRDAARRRTAGQRHTRGPHRPALRRARGRDRRQRPAADGRPVGARVPRQDRARSFRHSAPARPDVRCGDRRCRQAQHPGRAAAVGGQFATASPASSTAGDRARFTPVKTGIIGGLQIEIEGVAEGTEIVSGSIQALRDLQDGAPIRRTQARR